ncbi:MAG TPA: hypothetical protein VGY58_02550, partial [Gemmataceae bacterium]|nr:hypothetical protein [Gemmataceae bacterium]
HERQLRATGMGCGSPFHPFAIGDGPVTPFHPFAIGGPINPRLRFGLICHEWAAAPLRGG